MASSCSSGETPSDLTGDLASLICKGTVDEEVVKLYAEKDQIDVPDEDGKTPLMFACLKGLQDTVRFLLASGANPNSKSLKEGNTPMHYACMVQQPEEEDSLSGRYYYPYKWMSSKLAIIKLLISYGALAFQDNLDGWSPPYVASLYMLEDAVELFLSMDDFPLEVKIKAAEIFGVSQATLDHKTRCNNVFHSFSQAISFQQDARLTKAQTEISELTACFSKASLKECHTQEEMESVKQSKVALKAHAFLVGERILPENLKQRYLYPSLTRFASDLVFDEKMFEEGFQIMSCALGFERRGELKLGSVGGSLAEKCGLFWKKDKGPNSQYLQCTRDLMCAYEPVLTHVPIDSLSDSNSSLMESFGEILFNEAFYCSEVDILKSTLQAIEKSVRVIRGRICNENPEKYPELSSVTFRIMQLLGEAFVDNMYCGIHFRDLLRVKFVIFKVLVFDNASYKDSSGCNILHLVAYCVSTARDFDYLEDLARAFVRHGCPIDVVNKDGETARGILEEDEMYDHESDPAFLMLVSPPTTVLPLEELSIRAVLREHICYQDKLPPSLCEMIEDGVKESDLERGSEDSEKGGDD